MKHYINKEKLEKLMEERSYKPDTVNAIYAILSCLESEDEHKDICPYCEGNKDVGNCSHSKVKPISEEGCDIHLNTKPTPKPSKKEPTREEKIKDQRRNILEDAPEPTRLIV